MKTPSNGARLQSAALLLAGMLCVHEVHAQEVIDWSSFDFCHSCALESRVVVSLGDQEGDGVIEGEFMRVVAGTGHGYLVYRMGGGTRFLHFDEAGRFLRSVGSEGDGPGELRLIADLAFAEGGRVIALDYQRSAWITYDESGGFVGEVRSRQTPGLFRLTPGDSVAVVGTFDHRPASVGFPLHRVRLRDGITLDHFGRADTGWTTSEPYATSLVLGEDDRVDASVWWGKVGRPHIEEWTIDGRHLRTFTGELEWFRASTASQRGRSPPRVAVADFAVDAQDRLWFLTLVPDERWQEVPRYGAERGVIQEDYNRWQDARLDVFDLTTLQHLGFRVWDDVGTKLVQVGGAVFAFNIEYQTPLWPRVVLHEVDIEAPGRRSR